MSTKEPVTMSQPTRADAKSTRNVGRVKQVIGPTVDVEFHSDKLPNILNALKVVDEARATLTVVNSKGTEHTITKRYDVVGRGGRGFHLIKRDRLVRALPPGIALVDFG